MSAEIFTRGRGRPAVIAHRGTGPGVTPNGLRENSLPALAWAVDNGADWIEIDVQLSADGDLVLTHNVLLEGVPVRQLSSADLRGAGICTVQEAHDALPAHVGFDLDVKVSLFDTPGAEPNVFGLVADWAAGALATRPLVLTSFCPSLLNVHTNVALGWSTNDSAWYYESVASAVRLGCAVASVSAADVVDVPEGCPTAGEVAAFARAHGVAVKAWGVMPGDVPALVAGGVTGLCGDDIIGIAAALAALVGESTGRAA